jgi:hypothetical protein
MGGAIGWDTALQTGKSRVQFFPAALLPWGRLSLRQKW